MNLNLFRLLMDAAGADGAAGGAAGAAGAAAGAAGAGGAAAGAGDGKGGAADGAGADGKGGAAPGAGDGKGAGAAAPWGDNWRETYSGTDESRLNVLKRYDSPKAALDALFAARQKIDAGEVKAKLPANATAEQVAQYRKDNGLPETTDGYLAKLPQGLELDAAEKERIKPFLDRALSKGYSQETVNDFLEIRNQVIDQVIDRQVQLDGQQRQETEDALREAWGPDYRANTNAVSNLFATAPREVVEKLESARLTDGRGLFNNPDVRQYFAQLSRQLNPSATIVGADGHTLTAKGEDDRIAEIEAWMAQPKGSVGYRRYYDDAKVQTEYRKLLEARDVRAKRAA